MHVNFTKFFKYPKMTYTDSFFYSILVYTFQFKLIHPNYFLKIYGFSEQLCDCHNILVIFVSAMSIFMLLCISHYFCNDTKNTIYGCFFLNYITWLLFRAALNSLLESSIGGLVRNHFFKFFFVHISVCLYL